MIATFEFVEGGFVGRISNLLTVCVCVCVLIKKIYLFTVFSFKQTNEASDPAQ